MQGLMQRYELLIPSILTHAARHHPEAEVVSRRDDGQLARTTYLMVEQRARRLAAVLATLGVQPGDRVGTLAMNSDRHLELYYAIAGIGAVGNTVNPRLADADIAYIIEHAADRVLFVDPGFLPIVARIAPQLEGVLQTVVVLGDPEDMPPTTLPAGMALHRYETLLDGATPIAEWPSFDENRASGLCYTSGTTGRPKGVLYSHRSTLLHAMMMASADSLGPRATDRVLAAVPMFHVNAWGLPYIAPLMGASLVMPGRHLDPVSLLALLNDARATVAVGVPTVFISLLNHLRQTGERLQTLQRVVSGGSAFPRALIPEFAALGIQVSHAWGMTETSPIVTYNAPKPATAALEAQALLDQQATQGRVIFGVDMRPQDDTGAECPWDGKTQGNLAVRGHWIASGYYRQPEDSLTPAGWLPTGDVGVIHPDGFVLLTDRTKDLIKSGGEWISSIQLENIAMGHPEVAEAAAIAVPHPKWGERPLVLVVPRPGCAPKPEQIRAFYAAQVPHWSVPDQVLVVASLPHGATGKLLKAELRRTYA